MVLELLDRVKLRDLFDADVELGALLHELVALERLLDEANVGYEV